MTRVTPIRGEAHVSDFGANSDPLVIFAIGSSAVAGAITVALFVWVICLRWRLIADRRREAAFVSRWRARAAQRWLTSVCPSSDELSDNFSCTSGTSYTTVCVATQPSA